MAKVLTVKNPWALLIAQGIKDIENRTWKTNFRGRVLIHAAQGLTKGRLDNFLPITYIKPLSYKERYELTEKSESTRQQILCSVEIVDCVMNHPSIWAEKGKAFNLNGYGHSENYKPIWNWVLANPRPEPNYAGLKIKGSLSFWEFSEDKIIGKEETNG